MVTQTNTHSGDIIKGTLTFGVVNAELWAVGEGLVGSEAGLTSCGGRRDCQKNRKILQEVELVGIGGGIGPRALRRRQGMARGAWSQTSVEQSLRRRAVVEGERDTETDR